MRKSILIALVLLFVGCSDSSRRSASDAGPAADGASTDGSAPTDAGRADATTPPPDAGTGLSPTVICGALCPALAVCVGDPGTGCVTECATDLADCSAAQLNALAACQSAGCAMGAEGPAIIECIAMVTCVEMGGA